MLDQRDAVTEHGVVHRPGRVLDVVDVQRVDAEQRDVRLDHSLGEPPGQVRAS
ncbi:MAG: hypothetical protein ACRDST_09030 [Pseudonocardiaceae bacterium]